MYTYDAVGSYERSGYSSQGSGQTLIMPVLDNQLKSASPLVLPPRVSVKTYDLCVVCSMELFEIVVLNAFYVVLFSDCVLMLMRFPF